MVAVNDNAVARKHRLRTFVRLMSNTAQLTYSIHGVWKFATLRAFGRGCWKVISMRIGDFSIVAALLTASLFWVSFSQSIPQTAPQTGRTGARRVFNLFSIEQEIEIGRNSATAVEKSLTLLADVRVNEYVGCLGQALCARARARDFPYSFKIVDAPEVDAFAIPGGPIYLTRGMIEAAGGEGELAGVMAHEIAHVALRHGASQASKTYLAQAGLGGLGGVAGEAMARKIIEAVGGFGFNAVFLKYSPEAETEADAFAAQLMTRAGYDSREMTNFFQAARRRARGVAPKIQSFLDDHPMAEDQAPEDRIEREREASRPRQTQRMGVDFHRIQAYLMGLPRVSNQATVARRTLAVMEETSYDGPPINIRVERPSSNLRDYWQPGGFWFLTPYPENWKAFPSGDKLGVTFAPPGGVIETRGQTQLVYGAVINRYRPIGDNSEWTGLRRRSFRYIGGRGELVEATNDLLDSILQNNQHLDFARGSDRRGTKDGLTTITLTLTGRSPLTGRSERVQLYARELDDGDIVYAIFVAPDDEYRDFRSTFDRMLRGLKIDSGALKPSG